MFVGAVSDNFDERIERKIFHAEIMVDNEKVKRETASYKMCIRDSLYTLYEQTIGELELPLMKVFIPDTKRFKKELDAPVSYTHLILASTVPVLPFSLLYY